MKYGLTSTFIHPHGLQTTWKGNNWTGDLSGGVTDIVHPGCLLSVNISIAINSQQTLECLHWKVREYYLWLLPIDSFWKRKHGATVTVGLDRPYTHIHSRWTCSPRPLEDLVETMHWWKQSFQDLLLRVDNLSQECYFCCLLCLVLRVLWSRCSRVICGKGGICPPYRWMTSLCLSMDYEYGKKSTGASAVRVFVSATEKELSFCKQSSCVSGTKGESIHSDLVK